MKKTKYTLFFLFSIIFTETDNSIKELDTEKKKIELEIKEKNNEIKILNNDLKRIESKILSTTDELNNATEKAIKGQKDLISIEEQINRDKKIIKSIQSDLSNLETTIIKQIERISKKEAQIDSIEIIINNIETELDEMPLKIYQSQTNKNIPWKEKKFLKELINVEKENLKKELNYNNQKNILYKNKKEFENNLKDLEISLIDKKNLLVLKKKTLEKLKANKDIKAKVLTDLKEQKSDIERKLKKRKKEKKEKEKEIKSTEQLVEKLFQDKEKNKERTEELIRIRKEKNKVISGNFSKMKGKLDWPNDGRVEIKFGSQLNPELNTITENTGIEIKCSKDLKVKSVMDGIVMGIRYIPTYGNIIIIDHGEDYSTVYANLGRIFVTEDQYVSSGSLIGEVSDSGNKRKLLHFEVWKKDQKLNPETWLMKK